MMKKVFNPLMKGQIIDVVAPGFAPSSEEVQGALKFLTELGFLPRTNDPLLVKDILHSAPDEKRFEDLKKAFLAKDSQVIWCLRGGYGSNRLWPKLLKMKKPVKKKLLLGLSDITSLHHFVNQKWGWPSLHTAHLDRLGQGRAPEAVVKEIFDLLEGNSENTIFQNLKPMNSAASKLKKITSTVVGGNLVTLQSSLGTPTEINLKNKILFLEEIGERAYRIDRVLVHLAQSGVLKNCKAIIFGEFFKCQEPNGDLLYPKVLQRFASEISIPVFEGIETGHGEIQRPLFFGTTAVLQTSSGQSVLTVESPVASQPLSAKIRNRKK